MELNEKVLVISQQFMYDKLDGITEDYFNFRRIEKTCSLIAKRAFAEGNIVATKTDC